MLVDGEHVVVTEETVVVLLREGFASGLSILLYVVRESRDVSVKMAEYEDDHIRSEVDVEPELVSESIVTLHSYGSLFYASAQYFEQQLPHPTEQTRNTVVILNLRGQRDLDTTTVDMLTDYAQKLQAHDCRLMLAEVEQSARAVLNSANVPSIA